MRMLLPPPQTAEKLRRPAPHRPPIPSPQPPAPSPSLRRRPNHDPPPPPLAAAGQHHRRAAARPAAAAAAAATAAPVLAGAGGGVLGDRGARPRRPGRSEEHTSELPSLMRISYAVFCLKKKNQKTTQ